MKSLRPAYQMAANSHLGKVRQRNEDAIRIFPEHGIAVLSDGMGGHRAGNIASQMAVDIVARDLLPKATAADHSLTEQDLVSSLAAANKAIRSEAKHIPDYYGMGATAIVAVFSASGLLAAHLGDSRIYVYTDSTLTQLTEDHTLAQKYLNEGIINPVEARTWVGRNMLIKGLGIEKRVSPTITTRTITPGQIFVLCSDGLTDALTDDEIAAVLGRDTNLATMTSQLIDCANNNGGPDNISVIMVKAAAGDDA